MAVPKISLLNFELPSSRNCDYVLTSPRSLKACYKSGIKPVELLYKSRGEFAHDYGDTNKADKLYTDHEAERQKKIAMCLKMRNIIIKKESKHKKKTMVMKQEEDENKVPKTAESTELLDIRGESPNCTTSGIGTSPELMSSLKDLENISPRKLDSRTTGQSIVSDDIVLPGPRHFRTCEKRPSSRGRRGSRSAHKKKQKVVIRNRSLDNMNRVKPNELYPEVDYRQLKFEQLARNFYDREMKYQEVQRAQRDLDLWFERWQDKVMIEQWIAMNRAQHTASQILVDKLNFMKDKNKTKMLNHRHNLNKIKEMEDDKAEVLRRYIESKGRKIDILHEERERIIAESRSRAQAIADLKTYIREMLTPETFDRKLNKYNSGSRLSSMCSGNPLNMQASHIRLG